MNIHTKAVHAGDRKKSGAFTPVTTPVYTAASYIYDDMEQLDRVFAGDDPGYCYGRYHNPTSAALEEQVAALENGHGALACASGMAALHAALTTALADRRKSVLAASALYGATVKLLMNVLEPAEVAVRFVEAHDTRAFEAAFQEEKPAACCWRPSPITLLRVPEIDRIAQTCRAGGAALVVDNTFATPLLVRPWNWGRTSWCTAPPSTGRPRRCPGRRGGDRRGPLRAAAHALQGDRAGARSL